MRILNMRLFFQQSFCSLFYARSIIIDIKNRFRRICIRIFQWRILTVVLELTPAHSSNFHSSRSSFSRYRKSSISSRVFLLYQNLLFIFLFCFLFRNDSAPLTPEATHLLFISRMWLLIARDVVPVQLLLLFK